MNTSPIFDSIFARNSDIINNNNLSDNLFDNDITTSTTATTFLAATDDQAFIIPSIFTEQVSQTKLLASVILFTITLLCGYLPVRILLNQNYIQYAMFAGGGVLMATAFCHLIPEAHDNYRLVNMQLSQHQHQHQQQEKLDGSQQESNNSHSHSHSHSHNHSSPVVTLNFANNSNSNNNNTLSNTNSNRSDVHIHSHSHSDNTNGGGLNVPYLEVTLCCGFFFMYLVEQLMVRFINTHTHEHPCDTSMGQLVVGSNTAISNGAFGGGDDNSNRIASSAVSATSGITTSSRGGNNTGTELYKFIRGLLIVSAFGAHSIFDGVAIGSQESVEKVWTIFLAISCHKLIIAAVVGLELYTATLESHLWTLVHLSIFSIMSPIGILLVVVAQNSLHINSSHPAMILLQSFATGTLLYIVFVEILQPKEDQAYEKNRLGKSISLITGFALMLLVLTLIDE